jgi:adenine-specific DNA-methyltransferase
MSYASADGEGIHDNIVIQGDNLLGLKALEQEYAGRIKCIYIDPPYNSDSALGYFDDSIEHSLWLSLMRSRLEILWRLLDPDNGVILISINDDELHYLKVLCDEVFGRKKFVANLIWYYEGNTDNQAKIINYHEYVLVYSTTGEIDDPGVLDPNIGENSKLRNSEIRNTIVKNGPKNPVSAVHLPAGFPMAFDSGSITRGNTSWPQYDNVPQSVNYQLVEEVVATSGWSSKDLLTKFIDNGFRPIKDAKGQDTRFEISSTGAIEAVKARASSKGHVISVLRGFGTTNQMRILLEKIGIRFAYPKPVDLIAYLLEVFSKEDSIILDSFAGSGTTGHAVLKLNNNRTGSRRKFILVELSEETTESVLLPRLRAVIEGNAEAGLAAVGGGFRYYTLAPSLLQRDSYGNWIISKEYDGERLAQAMCKQLGFTYAPSDDPAQWWRHGQSTERDFLYVTTQSLTRDALKRLSNEVGPDRTLQVCARAFSGDIDGFENLTCCKIPTAILTKCEWGRDDYSLNVTDAAPTEDEVAEEQANG